jgi:hypothetical protein
VPDGSADDIQDTCSNVPAAIPTTLMSALDNLANAEEYLTDV